MSFYFMNKVTQLFLSFLNGYFVLFEVTFTVMTLSGVKNGALATTRSHLSNVKIMRMSCSLYALVEK